MGQTNNDCRFRISLLTSSLLQQPSLAGRLDSKLRYVLGHNFPGKYTVDQRSGDGWFGGWSKIFALYQRNSNTRFWDTRRENCFNTEQNHPEYPLQERGQSGGTKGSKKEDSFLWGRQIAYLIYEYFRVTNDSVEKDANLFMVVLRNDDIQKFDSTWDGILLSMTKIPSDDILEGFYKLRIRESEKLKTVLEWYDLETHQKKLGPDYRRLKTTIKKKYRAEFASEEFWRQKRKLWDKCRGQESGDKTVWKKSRRLLAMAVSDTIWISGQNRHSGSFPEIFHATEWEKMHREPEVLETEVPVRKWLDCRAKITLKELAPLHSVKSGTLQNACSTRPRVVAGLGKSALMRIARSMNSQAKGLKRMMTKVQCLCWKLHDNWVAYFKIWSRRSLHRFCGRAQTYGNQSDDQFTKVVVRHPNIRDQNPLLGMICPSDPHQRNPNAPKFEDRSLEETEWQEQGAREAAWKLAQSVLKKKERSMRAWKSNILLTFGK